MKKFFRRIFGTRYKIYPIYQDFKKVGFIVYEKCFLSPIYVGSNLDVVTQDGTVTSTGKAAFKTYDEAIDFIKSRTKYYTHETIYTEEKALS